MLKKSFLYLMLYLLLALVLDASEKPCSVSLKSLENNSNLDFIYHIEEDPTSFGNSLAFNVHYTPILKLRKLVSKKIGHKLKFYKGWDPKGEAHVTVITPPEYVSVLRHKMTMLEIHDIAKDKIQSADLSLLGIGSFRGQLEGHEEETFFLIVDSSVLREIRQDVFRLFIARGGDPKYFDPSWFFPHITIGYTEKDFHEKDGAIKNLKFSNDKRFVFDAEDWIVE